MIIPDKTCQLFIYGEENEDRQEDSYIAGCLDEFFADQSEISRPLILNHDSDKIVGAAKGRKGADGLEVFDIDIYDSFDKKDLFLEAITKGEMYMSYQFYSEAQNKESGYGQNIIKITDIIEFTLTPTPCNPISKIKSIDGKDTRTGSTRKIITIKPKKKMNKKFKALKKKALDTESLTDTEIEAFIMALSAIDQTPEVTAIVDALTAEKQSRIDDGTWTGDGSDSGDTTETDTTAKSADPEEAKPVTEKSVKQLIKQALESNKPKAKAVVNISASTTGNESISKAVADFKSGKGNFQIKGVGEAQFFERIEKRKVAGALMTTGNANTNFAFNGEFLGSFTPNAPIPLTNYLDSKKTSTFFLFYDDWAKKNGLPINVGEGASATTMDYNKTYSSLPLRRLPIKSIVSNHIFISQDDTTQGIKDMMDIDLVNALNSQIVNGDGNDPNAKGLISYATALVTTPFALKVKGANIGDVLTLAVRQQKSMLFQPSMVLVSSVDYTSLYLLKDTVMNSVNSKAITMNADGSLSVLGVPVVEHESVPADKFYSVAGGDIKFRYNSISGNTVKVVTDDTANLDAGTATMFLDINFNMVQPNAKTGAVVGGTISTIVTAITAP